jgi:ribonucleoside-diphosphate reductase alpha chain
MTSQTVSSVRAKLARQAKKNSQKITATAPFAPGSDGAKAARAAIRVNIDPGRDALLTNFGRATLQDRYLLAGETTQDLFARVARAYADDAEHAQRLYDYMSRLWFLPATPILSNGGTARGLPISCFLNSVEDNLDGIVGTWTENVWLASNGGGIGTYWGGVRSIGETVKGCGQTSGIIRRVHRDPQTLGRLQSQELEPAPRHLHHG